MQTGLKRMNQRIGYYGDGTSVDQWTRMREDKLKSLKKALHYSYQAAIVQKYNVSADSEARRLISFSTKIEKIATLNTDELSTLNGLADAFEEQYPELQNSQRFSDNYLQTLQVLIDNNSEEQPYFRCLINHDKLKVDYEDKILSIPFEENSVSIDPVKDLDDLQQTNFHNGTVFKWVHGNKEEWVPDTYWIVYMQYSEETAYFRGQIRKADQEINIVIIEEDGTETEQTYRGWMTGPNETDALWNVKKGVVWNDLNYTKLLYITKDENTLAFFKRFDKVNINGTPWEVVAYNENYGTTSKTVNSGIIRVALKQTYTSTDQQLKQFRKQSAEAAIIGPDTLAPYDTKIQYKAVNVEDGSTWEVVAVPGGDLSAISYYTQDNSLFINVETSKSYKKGFNIKYGDLTKHIVIKSL